MAPSRFPASVRRLANRPWRLGAAIANSPRWALWFGCAILGLLLVGTVLAELSRLVAAMHGPGEVSAGFERGLTGSVGNVEEVVETWRRHAAAAPDHAPAWRIAVWFYGLDQVLFVPLYAVALAAVLLRDRFRRALAESIVANRERRTESLAPAADLDAQRERSGLIAEASHDTMRAYYGVLDWTFLGVIGLVLADTAENLLSLVVLWVFWSGPAGGAGWLVGLLTLLTWGKWLLAAFVLAPLAMAGIQLARARWGRIGDVIELLRAQLVLVVVFAIVVLLRLQFPDVILRWDPTRAAWAVAAALLFGLANWALAHRLVRRWTVAAGAPLPEPRQPDRSIPARPVVLAAAVAIVAGAVFRASGGGPGAAVPAGLVLAGLLLGIPAGAAKSPPVPWARRSGPAEDVLARLLGISAVVVLGLAVVRAAAPTLLYLPGFDAGHALRLALGVGLVAVAPPLYGMLGRFDQRVDETVAGGGRDVRAAVVATSAAATAALAIAVWLAPHATAPAVGTVAVVVGALLAFALVGGGLAWAAEYLADGYRLPSVFRVFGLRRIPVFVLVAVWLVVASAVDTGTHWDVRVRDGGPPGDQPGLALDAAFDRWLAAQEPQPAATGAAAAAPGARPAVPLVLVAAEGGGIRAAYWTASVLDCVFEGRAGRPDPCAGGDAAGSRFERVLLGSGISGGSLGLVATTAAREAGEGENWVRERLGRDFLAPQVAWLLFVEVARSALHFPAADRGTVTEVAWERAWGEPGDGNPLSRGFLADQAGGGAPPFLVLNGASVLDGCSLNTSILSLALVAADATQGCLSPHAFTSRTEPLGNLAPATIDLLDLLCPGQDVARSTAALLSARFPFVSPAGRLERKCPDDEDEASALKYVVDGGYVESSGAETALAVWERLADLVAAHNEEAGDLCVVPFFLQVDNNYRFEPAPPSVPRVNQALVPAQAAGTAGRGARADRARAVAALEFGRPYAGAGAFLGDEPVEWRYARVTTAAHPGPQAPLGWVLSGAAQDDLDRQLGTADNAETIQRVRAWLEGPLTCRAP